MWFQHVCDGSEPECVGICWPFLVGPHLITKGFSIRNQPYLDWCVFWGPNAGEFADQEILPAVFD